MRLLNRFLQDVWRADRHPRLQRFLQDKRVSEIEAEAARLRAATDVFVLSYPKSGRTWHRFLLGHYLAESMARPLSMAMNVRELTSDCPGARVNYSHNGANFLDAISPRHPAVASPELWAGRKVIFIVREPKDILVSAWHHAHYRQRTYSGTIHEFVCSPTAGIEKILYAFNRWWDNRHRASAYIITSYERMSLSTADALRETLAFIDRWPIDEGLVMRAAAAASFENMRSLETSEAIEHAALRTRSRDERARKTREGRIGGYQDHLSAEDIAFVDEKVRMIGNPFREFLRARQPQSAID
jgi:hypothetical protein